MFDVTFEVLGDLCGAGPAADNDLLDLAARGRAVARIWDAPPSLIAPRSYGRLALFEQACTDFARRGVPVGLRLSGGGLVPQGPGILNVSLACSVEHGIEHYGESAYRRLCAIVQRALDRFAIHTEPSAVSGAFCDGRYDLAVDGRKIAGAAQYWKHAGPQRRIVLAHAIVLVDPDLEHVTDLANQFEAVLASGRAYDAEALTSVARCLGATGWDRGRGRSVTDAVRDALRSALG